MRDDSTTEDEAMDDEFSTRTSMAPALHPKSLFDTSNKRTKLVCVSHLFFFWLNCILMLSLI